YENGSWFLLLYDNTLNRIFLLEFGNGSDQIPNCLFRIRRGQSNHHDQQKHPEHSIPAPADPIYPTEPAAAPRIPLRLARHRANEPRVSARGGEQNHSRSGTPI